MFVWDQLVPELFSTKTVELNLNINESWGHESSMKTLALIVEISFGCFGFELICEM